MTKTMLNTFREHLQSLRLLTFKTFDQSDEKIWPDPTKRQQQRQRQRQDDDKYI